MSLAAKVSSFSLERPLFAITLIILTLMFSGFGLSRLAFEDGHESTFAADTVEYQNYQRFAEQFSTTGNNLVVLITSPAEFSANDIAGLHDFVLDVHLADGVEAVFSIFSLQNLNPEDGAIEPMFAALTSNPDATTIDLNAILQSAQQTSYTGLSLLNDGLAETVVVVSLNRSVDKLDQAAPVLDELTALTAEFSERTALTARITGLLPIRDHVVSQIQRDQPVINLLGALLGFVTSLVLFRSPWIALCNGVAPVVALLTSLGLMGALGFEVNVINTALPVLVMVLASSDCTHITYEICKHARGNGDMRQAIATAMRELISPCVLTSLTTMLAFASLSYSSSPIIRDLAITGALSVGAALCAVLIVHPLVFSAAIRFAPLRRALRRPLRAEATGTWRVKFFAGILRKKIALSLLALGLAALCVLAILPIQTSYQFSENIKDDTPLVQTLKHVEDFSGPTTAIAIPVRVTGNRGPITPEVLSELASVHRAVENLRPELSVVSLHTIERFLISQGADANVAAVQDILDVLPEYYLHRMISADATGFLISVMVPDLGSQELRTLGKEITAEIASVPLSTLQVEAPTDLLTLSANASHDMILQLVASFAIAAICCPLLIGIWFRRLDFMFLSILPNVLPILVMGAALMISGVDVQFTSALALTIAFGIAVDDTIHVFNRLHLEAGSTAGRLTPAVIANALSRVAPALVTTTLILSAGLVTVLWSDLPMIEYFGLLCIGTFMLALVADIVFLPALAGLLAGVRRNGEEG